MFLCNPQPHISSSPSPSFPFFLPTAGGLPFFMDSSEFSDMGKPSPRRELQLQGPRPAPLKVRKESHKIRKPPVAPAAAAAPSQQPNPPPPPPQQQHRPPVIIYTVSPKVIHTKPSEFMMLVQRLTGASSSSSSAAAAALPSSAVSPSGCFSPGAGALSPAARLAMIERTQTSSSSVADKLVAGAEEGLLDIVDQLGIGGGTTTLDRSGNFPGILSPLPSSLPQISPNFFSPPSADPNSLAFLNDMMSPLFQSSNNNNSNYMENTFLLPSPSNLFSTSTLPSPGMYWDLFNQL